MRVVVTVIVMMGVMVTAGAIPVGDVGGDLEDVWANITALWHKVEEVQDEINNHLHHGHTDDNHDQLEQEVVKLQHEHEVHHLHHPDLYHNQHHSTDLLNHLEEVHGHSHHHDHTGETDPQDDGDHSHDHGNHGDHDHHDSQQDHQEDGHDSHGLHGHGHHEHEHHENGHHDHGHHEDGHHEHRHHDDGHHEHGHHEHGHHDDRHHEDGHHEHGHHDHGHGHEAQEGQTVPILLPKVGLALAPLRPWKNTDDDDSNEDDDHDSEEDTHDNHEHGHDHDHHEHGHDHDHHEHSHDHDHHDSHEHEHSHDHHNDSHEHEHGHDHHNDSHEHEHSHDHHHDDHDHHHDDHHHDHHHRGHQHDPWVHASCSLEPNVDLPDSHVKGTIIISQKRGGRGPVYFDLDLTGFDPQDGLVHGFHVHELPVTDGSCGSTGGHFNPFSTTHGGPESTPRHVGDLGNIEINEAGSIENHIITDHHAAFSGNNTVIGKAIVVHAGEDDLGQGGDQGSLTTGNAGGRLACCTIHIQVETYFRFKG